MRYCVVMGYGTNCVLTLLCHKAGSRLGRILWEILVTGAQGKHE